MSSPCYALCAFLCYSLAFWNSGKITSQATLRYSLTHILHQYLNTCDRTHIARSIITRRSKLFMALKRHLMSTSKDATAEDVDVLDIDSSMTPPRRSKRLKSSTPTLEINLSRSLVRLSQSEDDSRDYLLRTETSSFEETTAQAVNLAKKLPPTYSIEGSRMVTQSSQPRQSSRYRQRENQPTSCPSNNDSLLNSSASLKQRPATITADNGYGYSKPNLPTRVLLTKHTFTHKPSGKSKQGRAKLLELPLDILCLIADNLDVVARACLRYAHPALGFWCNGDLSNLSLCARSGIVSLLLRDGASIPEQLLGVARKGTDKGHCSEYQKIMPKYCVTCRCHGHLSHCPGCQIRTCVREGT